LDGKNEILFSGIEGNYILFECTGDDEYEIIYEGDNELYNAYKSFVTNDIDKNGYPEFWIGGDDFNNQAFKIIGYQSTGDNTYQRLTSISILYLSAYPYGYLDAMDYNNDGDDEIFIELNEYMLILDLAGTTNNYYFKILYYGIIKPEFELTYVDNITLYDIFNRGKTDILVSLTEHNLNDYYHSTYIY
jgi:hypothetical protein